MKLTRKIENLITMSKEQVSNITKAVHSNEALEGFWCDKILAREMDNPLSTLTEKLSILKTVIHNNALSKGFWDDKTLSREHYLMLVITEVAEVIEEDRKFKDYYRISKSCLHSYINEVINPNDDSKAERNETRSEQYKRFIKGSIEEELADVAIRMLDFIGGFGIDIDSSAINGGINSLRGIESFPKKMFILTISITKCACHTHYASVVLSELIFIAESMGIDLLWHIIEKIKFNATRPSMHNKKY